MNGFTKRSIGTLTLGEKLKKLRESKRISLNDVSYATGIQVKYLEYLENGNYEKLPVDVYIKGFIRKYAEFMGMEEAGFLRIYEKEREIKKNLDKNRKSNNTKINPINISAFVFTPKKLIFFLVFILVGGGIFLLYKEIGSFAENPKLVILNPENNSRVKGNSLSMEGITEKDGLLFINDHPILVNEDGKFKENITLQSGSNVINIKAVNKFKKETQETITVFSEISEEKRPDDNPEEKMQMEIKVEPGPVWLSVEADGNLVFSGTMLSGAVQSFKAKEKIIISSGRGEATFIKLNGKDLGALNSEPGAVREKEFKKEDWLK
jgi:transcriptional regulator with XRE-family HTH domain